MEEVLISRSVDIGYITINRPDRGNALSFQVLRSILDGLHVLEDNTKVIIISGIGDKSFSTGLDLGDESLFGPDGGTHLVGELIRKIWNSPAVVVSKVKGNALAGGFGLAIAADMVIAAENARFAMPEVDAGLWPFQITIPLTRFGPPRLVLEMMMTGRSISAAEALQAYLINHVVKLDEIDGFVDRIAKEVAGKAGRSLRLGKQTFYRTMGPHDDLTFDYLRNALELVAKHAPRGSRKVEGDASSDSGSF
jgi:enoyl-CoA hydratase/carnithine racemase